MMESAIRGFQEEVILEPGFEECFGVSQTYKRGESVFLTK